MQKKITGVVVDKFEGTNGQMLTLLSADEGLVSILIEPSLEPEFIYAKELLTFAHFTAKQTSGMFYVLLKCEVIDAFSHIKNSEPALKQAQNLCSAVKELAQFNDANPSLFLEFMTVLKALNYSAASPRLAFLKFLASALNAFAPNLNFDICARCGNTLNAFRYFDPLNCQFLCKDCQDPHAMFVGENTIKFLKLLMSTPYERLGTSPLHITEESEKTLAKRTHNARKMVEALLIKTCQLKTSERLKFYSE